MIDSSGITEFTRRLQQDMASWRKDRACAGGLEDEAQFNTRALDLFALQFEVVPVLNRVASQRGLGPSSVPDWREIPDLPSSAFKEFEVTSISGLDRVACFHSSGTTTQRPSRHFHSAESLALYETSLAAGFEANLIAGLPACAAPRIISLTPPSDAAPHSSLAHMASTVVREFGAPGSLCVGRVDAGGAWGFELEQVRTAIQGGGGEPVVLFGTAFSFVHWLDGMAEVHLRLRLPEGSRVMETGGYKGRTREMPRAELHMRLSEALGIPAVDIVREYGMSELSSQAYDGPGSWTGEGRDREWFRFPPWVRTLIVSPETGREVAIGEAGLLRVVDLANVRSVLSVQTGDLAVRRAGGFELIGRPRQSAPRGCSLMAA